MSRIESGTQTAQAVQIPVSIALHDKTAGNRPAAARPVKQPGNATDAATIRVRNDFAQLQNINDRQNSVAVQLRNDDQQLRESDRLLGQMKRVLTDIIKYYPPYPAGETERVKFLRSFSAMRQQIEQLTIPPEKTWKGSMPGEPLSQAETMQTGGPSGNAEAAVVPGVATAFDIPELPDTADNVQIEKTLDRIDNAQAAIAGKRAGISEQASNINQSEGFGAKAGELVRTSQETWDLAPTPQNEAEQKSISAGNGLQQAAVGITNTDMQPLLQALAG